MKIPFLPKLTSLILLIALSSSVAAQMKLVRKILSNEADTSRSGSFIALPAIAYAQETGLEIGAVSLYSFYTDRHDTLIRTSRITGIATFTTKKQSNFQLKADIWSPGNNYHYISEIRYKNFPFNFYGTGNKTLQANEDRITQKLFKLNGSVEKRFGKTMYTGFGAGYESYRFYDKEAGGIFETDPMLNDRDGGKVLFLDISQIIDNRNTNTYTTKGQYLKVSYSYAPQFFGGDNFNGSMFKADLRNFSSIGKKVVLGINGLYHSIRSGNTPFYLLPQLGNDAMMRGYYTGRYRDENLLALQAELRYRINGRFGLAGFTGAGTVYSSGNFVLSDLKPSTGAGLRYFFDIEKGLSIRLDYGMGEKRPGEKRQTGFYISLGESF